MQNFFNSAENGNISDVKRRLDDGINKDTQNENGYTALMYASYHGEIPIVISLIEAGCDYSLRNKEGKSAMDYLREEHPDKVKEVQVSRSPTAVVTHSLI